MNSLYLSPGEVISAYCAGSEKKFRSSALRLLLLGVLAGAIIASAAAASNTAVYGISDTWTLRTICALLFPFGLGLVIVTGSELFTGNCMLPVALLDRRGTVGQMLRNWVLVYAGKKSPEEVMAVAETLDEHMYATYGYGVACWYTPATFWGPCWWPDCASSADSWTTPPGRWRYTPSGWGPPNAHFLLGMPSDWVFYVISWSALG